MNLLVDYAISLTHLYGLVHKQKVIDIYNQQNSRKVTLTDLEKVIDEYNDNLTNSFAIDYGNYLVQEAIYLFDEFDLYFSKQQNKPNYIPSKTELLKYRDPYYFEKSIEYVALRKYIERNFFLGKRYQAEEICSDIHLACQTDFSMDDVFYQFERRKITFENERQMTEVVELVLDLANNVRLWENNGFTPAELSAKMRQNTPVNVFRTDTVPINRDAGAVNRDQDRADDRIKKNHQYKNLGRNDPCPCGSGKKYKKCCL